MAGQLKAAFSVVSISVLALLLLTLSGHDAEADTFSGEYSITLSSTAAGAAADSTSDYNQTGPACPPAGAGCNANFARVDSAAAPPNAAIATDGQIPDGQRVGKIRSFSTLGLLNANCSTPITVDIPFMDATTDINNTADWIGTGTNLVFDDDLDATPGETSDSNLVPTYADHYPSYLNEIFTDTSGDPIAPRARYVGHTEVLLNSPATQLNFVVFSPGDLSQLPPPEDAMGDDFGYVNFVVLNNPAAPAAPSTITAFCTPLTTTTTLTGTTKGEYRVVDGPEPIEVDRVKECTVVLAGPLDTIIPKGDDSDGDTVADDGCLFIDDPCGGFDYTGDTTVSDAQGEDPAPDSDDDGDTTVDEGCDTGRALNPAAGSGLYGTGTHLVRSYSQGLRDVDNDGWENSDDNCAVTANATQADGDADGLGDACDPVPGTPSAGATPPDAVNQDGDSWPAASGATESGPECTGAAGNNELPHVDDDGDTVINDGCGDARNEDPVDNADNDGDTLLDEDGECKATSALPDQDGDCYANEGDNCPRVANDQRDLDESGVSGAGDVGATTDSIGDQCEPDWDGDTTGDGLTGPVGETPAQCGNSADDDGDTVVNDGCASGGSRSEVGAECFNDTNDDVDTLRTLGTGDDVADDALVNDGCPAVGGGVADGDYAANIAYGYICVGEADTDGDGVCDSTEDLAPGGNLLSDKNDANSTPEYKGLDYDALQVDNDGDTVLDDAPGTCSDLDLYPGGAGIDNDGDGNTNGADPNCSTDPVLGTLPDTDGDGVGDNVDNCDLSDNPTQLNTNGDTEGDACDEDDDGDGAFDTRESYQGVDSKDPCPDDSSDDAWNLDIDKSKKLTIVDVLFYSGRIQKVPSDGETLPDGRGLRRLDHDQSDKLTIVDVLFYSGRIQEQCI